jgi:aspartyl-tRNA(Asn)/glutamyl-tRNA(Gln) amidotransferase subunit C
MEKSKTKNQKLSKEEVGHVAKLGGLTLTPKEVKRFQKQLSEILDYVEMLNKVSTEEVEPTSQVTGLENVFREDEIGPSFPPKEVLQGSKNVHKGMFKIKRILLLA